jgi:magnesium chelatase subunit D
MTPVFPFSAVIGQERLKQALLLCAVDPSIGGLLVRGPRGIAKTTLARAFAQLLPGRFVELPLGASEERVTGTLDLDAALDGRRVQFAPGLLARAHEGVLYVDEANLLGDALVDVVLDAAASGVNIVERDGVSHAHPARFVLVGTMNPDEGELRPQFIDRFGLCVDAATNIPPGERMSIVAQRLEFDRDPEGFLARFAAEQRALQERCRQARERVAQVALAGPALARVAELCHGAGVEGVRADLAMLRAARARAAWHGRTSITLDDVADVAELALAHRRRVAPPSPSSASGGGAKGSPPSSPGMAGGDPSARGESLGATGAHTASHGWQGPLRAGDRGALPAVPVQARACPPLPAQLLRGSALRRRAHGTPAAGARRRKHALASLSGVDWFKTLLHNPRPALADLRYRSSPRAARPVWLIALDCSSSMLRSGSLAVAKGMAASLAQSALRLRARVALIAFNGEHARGDALATPRNGLVRAIGQLAGGGGTPLRAALLLALVLGRRLAHTRAGVDRRFFLLTDGRSRDDVSDVARAYREFDVLLIDCERARVRLGRARDVAVALSARYIHVDALVDALEVSA